MLVACADILSIDHYRPCEGAECTAGVDASDEMLVDAPADAPADATTDTQPEAAGAPCSTSSECAPAAPVCSSSKCASILSLSSGMSAFQCAVLSDFTARCWGTSNPYAELGAGPSSAPTKPTTVLDSNGTAPLANIQKIVTGLAYGCALTLDGSVYCWGTDVVAPALLPTFVLSDVRDISGAGGVNAGEGSMCAVRSDSTLSCWGFNYDGRIACPSSDMMPDAGACTGTSVNLPPTVLTSASAVAANTDTTCAFLGSPWNLQCWGTNSFGGIGAGSLEPAPCCSAGTTGVIEGGAVSIVAGDAYTCALSSTAGWYCWGLSQGGAILGAQPNSIVASPLHSAVPSAGYSPGWAHGCAVAGDGSGHVQCWGQNDHGQVGNGTTNAVGDYVLTPVTVSKLVGVTLASSHRNFTCAKNGDGQIYCWGQNIYGPLLGAGNSTADITSPAVVVWD
jgi:alpha-tubulin suppressor-like RCC1 family protein